MNNFLPSTPNFLSSSSSCPLSVTKQGLCWLGNQNIKLVSTVSILRISRLWVSTGEGSGTPSSVLAWRIPGTGAWWASIYGVAQSWTRLKRLNSSSSMLIYKCDEWQQWNKGGRNRMILLVQRNATDFCILINHILLPCWIHLLVLIVFMWRFCVIEDHVIWKLL